MVTTLLGPLRRKINTFLCSSPKKNQIALNLWMRTHTVLQNNEGYLYSVSIFSREYVHHRFSNGGRFRQNLFIRNSTIDADRSVEESKF
jgi:hypothetical protein